MNNPRPIKFRQRYKNLTHYWGYIKDSFVGPRDFTVPSEQFTGILDCDKNEVYENDIIDVFDWGYRTKDKLLGMATVKWNKDTNGWQHSPNFGIDIDDMWRNVRVKKEK